MFDLISHVYSQSDGIGGFFSALFTVAPLSVFAQVRFLTGDLMENTDMPRIS